MNYYINDYLKQIKTYESKLIKGDYSNKKDCEQRIPFILYIDDEPYSATTNNGISTSIFILDHFTDNDCVVLNLVFVLPTITINRLTINEEDLLNLYYNGEAKLYYTNAFISLNINTIVAIDPLGIQDVYESACPITPNYDLELSGFSKNNTELQSKYEFKLHSYNPYNTNLNYKLMDNVINTIFILDENTGVITIENASLDTGKYNTDIKISDSNMNEYMCNINVIITN